MAIAVIVCILAVLCTSEVHGSRLSVRGRGFRLNGESVFLSGGNLPWIHYAYDYGNNQWEGVKAAMEKEMQLLHDAGGNTMRLWIHIQGESTPQFDSNGYVIATDEQGTFIDDVKDMLDLAQSYDILVIPTLWNCAVNQDYSHHLDGLIVDPRKLTSYIDVVLTPLVEAVKGHPALGAWDIVNEPEGKIIPLLSDPEPCYDTLHFNDSGAGWAGFNYTYDQMLRFINWQADAIKQEDPEALVTVGVWNPKSSTDRFEMTDHYTDECLIKAGKRPLGTLDFYQYHSYSFNGSLFEDASPFLNNYRSYGVRKPIVIGEFDEKEGGGYTVFELFSRAYMYGYAGALSWCLIENGTEHRPAMSYIRPFNFYGKIDIDI